MAKDTGRYPHGNCSCIEYARDEQIAAQKGFKQARPPHTEWLMKQNAVRQAAEPEYHPHKGKEQL